MNKIILLLSIFMLLFACAGEETLGTNDDPPERPQLISHLGDTGDGGSWQEPGTNYYNTSVSEFEQNGVDAISDGDQVQIQWEPFQDSDIDYYKVYRFTYEDYLADTLNFYSLIDTVDYDNDPNKTENTYIDSDPPIQKKLFYFIEIFNSAGLSAISDTVCYMLHIKPALTFIANPVSSIYDVTFSWNTDDNISGYRILLFDTNYNLLWQYTPLEYDLAQLDTIPIPYQGDEIIGPATLYRRVDAFGEDFYTTPIHGQSYQVQSGSESEERILILE